MLGAIEWGDFPTWVQAVTTTAALVAAGYAVWLERTSRREAADERRREQASGVGVWPATSGPMPLETNYFVRNDSGRPIFTVSVRAQVGPDDADEETVWGPLEVLAPGITVEIAVPRKVAPVVADELGAIVLRFVDSAGLRWRKSAAGELVEYPSDVRPRVRYPEPPRALSGRQHGSS